MEDREYWSIEAMPKDIEEMAVLTPAGIKQYDQDTRFVDFVDQFGNGWYKTEKKMANGDWVSLQYWLFGNRRIPEGRKKRRA